MKKKVAIVSLVYFAKNYGAILQSIALKKCVAELGYEAELLRINPSVNIISRLKRALTKYSLFEIAKKVVVRLFFSRIANNMRHKYMRETALEITGGEEYNNSAQLLKADELYDIFLVGSDHVWTDCGNYINVLEMFYLSGIKKPKVSYAPSMGDISNFDRRNVPLISALLKEFEFISVRENSGKEFLEEILDNEKEIFHAVDPVLLLSVSEWEKILEDNKTDFMYQNEKYVFAFLLGHSKEQREFIRKISRTKNLRIISFPHLDVYSKQDNGFADIDITNAKPYEFLQYIKNADYVFTHSFHASVFSGLFHKNFFVFKRENQNFARIEDLLNLFDCNERYISDLSVDVKKLDNIATDWVHLDKSVEVRRLECTDWLKNSLQFCENIE